MIIAFNVQNQSLNYHNALNIINMLTYNVAASSLLEVTSALVLG
jgi:hypothetical protein